MPVNRNPKGGNSIRVTYSRIFWLGENFSCLSTKLKVLSQLLDLHRYFYPFLVIYNYFLQPKNPKIPAIIIPPKNNVPLIKPPMKLSTPIIAITLNTIFIVIE